MKVSWVDLAIVILICFALGFINFDKETIKALITGGVISWLLVKRGILK